MYNALGSIGGLDINPVLLYYPLNEDENLAKLSNILQALSIYIIKHVLIRGRIVRMSLELIREGIKVNQLIGEDSTQTVVENDIIVPDVKPDIASILLADGEIFINSTEAMQDKVLVNGTIRYNILYVSDEAEGAVKSINSNSNFSYALDIENTRQSMKCRAKCDIEHIDYEVLNGRKINVKVILSISGKVYEEIEYEIANDLRGLEDIQVLREKADINVYLGSTELSCRISEGLEVPSGKPTIRELLRNDVKISGKDFKVTEGRIIAKGELNISTLYVGDDEERSIQFMEHEVPFTQFIDLDGIDDNSMCDIELRVTDIQFDPAEDSDGELRMLSGEVGLSIFASAYNKRSLDVIEDAYSPQIRISLEKEPFNMEDVVTETRGQVVIKDNISIYGDKPEIAELFNVISKPSLSEYRVMDDKVMLEGVVRNNLLYLANNDQQPILCHQQEIPFKQVIEVKGIKDDMSCEMDLDVDHCNYSMISGNEVEIRLVIGVTVKVINKINIPQISKVNENPIDENKLTSRPSLIIYFSQPGDSLWKIAKKYCITMEEIQKANSMGENESILPGQQVIIPRRV